MNKIYTKLIAMALALVLSLSVAGMASYAWLVLAQNPVATGIQVAIGGGNTILTAPDLTQTGEDGTVYHYPGHFSPSLNFGEQSSYAYLLEIGNLSPVSTYNGIDWFLPTYYTSNDEEVQDGRVPSGTLKDIREFNVDSELIHANLPATKENEEMIEEGSYLYLDFWVVSPGGDYTLRISTGDELNGGSFVVDLLEPVASGDSYALQYPDGAASTAVRVGFLANDYKLTDDTMLLYQNSASFDERYTSLRGIYQEPSSGTAYFDGDRFTIYEPNGDSHPGNTDIDGTYVRTNPIALVKGTITDELSLNGKLTVQRTSLWKGVDSGTDKTIQQVFQAALLTKDVSGMAETEISDMFYRSYLQGQIAPYVNKADFIKKTSSLYALGESATEQELDALDHAGATDDAYIIKLEQNVPQRIRMFIWLEGQDVDCVDSVASSRFAVNIELAGGSE